MSRIVAQGGVLEFDESFAAGSRQREKLEEVLFGERLLFRRPLHFDNCARAGENEVCVRVGTGVLRIVQVKNRSPLVYPTAHCRDMIGQRLFIHDTTGLHLRKRVVERHKSTGDRRGTGTAVRLNDIAIDLDLALAEGLQVDHGTQTAANQPLNFERAATLPAAGRLSVRALVRGPGSIPYSAVTQPRPELRNQGGTRSSRLAVHRTCVSPNRAMHDPSACFENPGSRTISRSSSARRPDGRMPLP